jgi:hypothetical protein
MSKTVICKVWSGEGEFNEDNGVFDGTLEQFDENFGIHAGTVTREMVESFCVKMGWNVRFYEAH